jgi:hypothetical protein
MIPIVATKSDTIVDYIVARFLLPKAKIKKVSKLKPRPSQSPTFNPQPKSKRGARPCGWVRSSAHKPARNSAGCANSQAFGIERFVALGGGVAQDSIKAGPGLRIGQPAFPCFVILTGEEEAGKIRQLGLFVWRQSLASLDDFRSGIAHDR